jgi:hypothetical protein
MSYQYSYEIQNPKQKIATENCCSCKTPKIVRGVCTDCYFTIPVSKINNHIHLVGETLFIKPEHLTDIITNVSKFSDIVKTMYIKDCKCEDIQFQSFKNLESMNIINSEFDNLNFLKNNPNLIRLDIKQSKINNTDAIGGLTALKRLVISDTTLFDISSLTSLELLTIDTCGELKDLSFLKEMCSLYELSISNCPIDVFQFPKLDGLQNLILRDIGHINDLDLSVLINLKILDVKQSVSNIRILNLPKRIHTLKVDGWLKSVDFLKDMNRLTYIDVGVVDDIDFKPIFDTKRKKIYNICLRSLNRIESLINFLHTIDTEGISYEIENEPSYEEFFNDEIEYGSE